MRGLITGTGVAWGPTDEVVVRMFARTLAELVVIERFFDVKGMFDKDSNLRPVMKQYIALKNTALRQADALGLTPAARLRLGLAVVKGMDAAAQIADARSKAAGGGQV